MATLEKIRRRAGVLVMGVIGLAMLGFILGDFNIRPSTKVAEINGKTFGVEDYQNEKQTLLNFYKMNYGENLAPEMEQQIEDETWRRMVRTNVMSESYKQLGLEVSLEELKAMVEGDQSAGMTGSNAVFSEPHPIVLQMFSNPETGEFNRYIMMNYFNSLGKEEYAQEKTRWAFIENEIVTERMNQKFLTLISKGLAPTSLEVKDYFYENGKKVDFNYLAKNFASVSDEDISVSESDLKAYFEEHKESYKRKETRAIEYVVFEVTSSDNDDANAKLWAKQTKNEFGRIKNANLLSYVNGISDEPFDVRFYASDDLSDVLKDSLIAAEEGSIFGPYFENSAYKLSKVFDAQNRPDSVRARHILLGYSMIGDVNRAKVLADSLKTVIENGGNFNEIAKNYSADQSNSAIGGDLGWFEEGQMETEFNNACFENKTGDLVTAETRYGIHIIKIENQSKAVEKVQIATIVHSVYPSNETDQEYYNRAVKFRGKATNVEKFEEQAKEFGLDPRVVPGITKDQRTIAGLTSPVQIIGWTYNSEKGDVSTIFDVDDKYIVAAITEVQKDGYADLESVRNEIELEVKKQKKAEVLMASMSESVKNATDLSSVAAALDLKVEDASKVQFANTYVSGIGMEPYIVGASMYLPEEIVAGPYKGENSVFILSVTNREEADMTTDMTEAKNRLKYAMQSRSNYESYNAMLESANVEDNRLEIYY